MDTLSMLCDIIILIGAVFAAITAILAFLGKPIKFVRKQQDNQLKQKINNQLNEVLPLKLQEHDLEVREKYLADRERYLQEIKKSVLEEVQDEIDEIKSLGKNQEVLGTQIKELRAMYDILAMGTRDVLREKIMMIHQKNRKKRCMTIYEREALEQYYKDYKAAKGNSYIDKYYARMEKWDTLPEEDFDDTEYFTEQL